jgi:hypothetical protein
MINIDWALVGRVALGIFAAGLFLLLFIAMLSYGDDE